MVSVYEQGSGHGQPLARHDLVILGAEETGQDHLSLRPTCLQPRLVSLILAGHKQRRIHASMHRRHPLPSCRPINSDAPLCICQLALRG